MSFALEVTAGICNGTVLLLAYVCAKKPECSAVPTNKSKKSFVSPTLGVSHSSNFRKMFTATMISPAFISVLQKVSFCQRLSLKGSSNETFLRKR